MDRRSNAGFITMTSGASGTGNGVVGFSVAANTGAARNGTLTIAGNTYTVNQSAGTPGSLAINTPSQATVGQRRLAVFDCSVGLGRQARLYLVIDGIAARGAHAEYFAGHHFRDAHSLRNISDSTIGRHRQQWVIQSQNFSITINPPPRRDSPLQTLRSPPA